MSGAQIDLAELPQHRTRRFKGRQEVPERDPDVIEDTINGKPVVRVELFGAACQPVDRRSGPVRPH
jgi:hypothetical protein